MLHEIQKELMFQQVAEYPGDKIVKYFQVVLNNFYVSLID